MSDELVATCGKCGAVMEWDDTTEEYRKHYCVGPSKPDTRLPFSVWLNTEGGRKCPQCGRYARSAELGWIGFNTPGLHVDFYGHLPGFGCNS